PERSGLSRPDALTGPNCPPVAGGAGLVDGPLHTTAAVTPAATITTTAMIAATTAACSRCSTTSAPTKFSSAVNAVCSVLRVASSPTPASTNAISAVSTMPRVPNGIVLTALIAFVLAGMGLLATRNTLHTAL